MTDKKYSVSNIKLLGIDVEFKQAHLPFIVVDDVLGCLALEGTSGSGKTTLAKRIGTLNQLANGGKVKVYSADKARYEDFIGIPIPDEKTGKMKIYPMENSVSEMETVVIDEANRASYENQEKWMSLCATREIDGILTKCKYIYLAMNPVLGEENDSYEGVQPLDKAMGERVYALITMNRFSKLPKAVRLEVLKASVANQTNWQPSEEDVALHKFYVDTARSLYEESKSTVLDNILDYIDGIQADLKKETGGVISIEARRAQFIVTNILGIHALNNVYNSTSLEQSALEALSLSFPNRLWEQPIPLEAIKMCHERHRASLRQSATERAKNLLDFEGLELSLKEISDYASKTPLPSKEQISKVINQNLPDIKTSPVNYYVFAIGASLGLTLKTPAKKQKVMKEQEFSRLQEIAQKVEDTPQYKKYRQYRDIIEKTNKVPENMEIPEYIAQDGGDTKNFDALITQIFGLEFTAHVLGIIEVLKLKPETSKPFLEISDKLVQTIKIFDKVADRYANN